MLVESSGSDRRAVTGELSPELEVTAEIKAGWDVGCLESINYERGVPGTAF